MDLRQLRQFVAVAEELSFRGAALRLHVSQPPLSVAVQRLEASLGVTLMERSRHGVRLTAAGAAFLREAQRTLRQVEVAADVARRAAAGKFGTLSLSFVPSAGLEVVPRLLRKFHSNYPDVKLVLRSATTSRQMEALVNGTTDLAVVVPPLYDAQDFQLETCATQDLVLAVPQYHPLAGRKQVQLASLAAESFIGFTFEEGPGFESVVLAACRESGFIPNFVEMAAQMQTILALVDSGLGVALVPQAMRAVRLEHVAYLQVRRGRVPLRYALQLAYRPSNSNPALHAFMAMAQQRS